MKQFKVIQLINVSEFILNTGNVKYMEGMFCCCTFLKGFISLGSNFDTSGVVNMTRMFYESTFMDEFTLGNKFIISSATDTEDMFCGCVFKKSIDLGNGFQTNCSTNIFERSNLPDDVLKLPNNEIVDFLNSKVKEKSEG